MRTLSTFLSLILIPLVAVMPLRADMVTLVADPGTTNPVNQNKVLQIRLAEDSKATVSASTSVKGYALLVTDSSGLPVSDAAVALRLPDEGPTGFFLDGARSAVAYTDASGVAHFPQVNWGSTVGNIAIRVTAVKGDMHAAALIEQKIVPARAPVIPVLAASAETNSATIQPPTSTASIPSSTTPSSTTPASTTTSPTPGTPTSVASVHSGATPERATPGTSQTSASADPAVTIVNTGSQSSHGNNKKWMILAAVAVGAGVGVALALAGKGSSPTVAATPGLSIGSPTISLGH